MSDFGVSALLRGKLGRVSQLAIETGLGSLELMQLSDQRPSALVDEVVSPNGVTHALLTSLDSNEWPQIIEGSIQAAVDRSKELS